MLSESDVSALATDESLDCLNATAWSSVPFPKQLWKNTCLEESQCSDDTIIPEGYILLWAVKDRVQGDWSDAHKMDYGSQMDQAMKLKFVSQNLETLRFNYIN